MTRKEHIEKAVRKILCQKIIESCGDAWEEGSDPENWISEFFWAGSCLYTSTDALSNPSLTATLTKGFLY